MTSVLMIGCGQIALDGYLPALEFLRLKRVVLYDVDPDKSGFCANHLAQRGTLEFAAVQNLDSAVSMCDVAILALPPFAASETVETIVNRHQPPSAILVEKPAGTCMRDAERMRVACASRGVRLCYMETFLHASAVDMILEELALGRAGEIREIDMSFAGRMPQNLAQVWRGDRLQGGEVLHDWGIHSLGLLEAILEAARIPQLSPEEITVKDCIWEELSGSKQALVRALLNIARPSLNISVDVSWLGHREPRPDLIITCDESTFFLTVSKKDGRSHWMAYELTNHGVEQCRVEARYPKELFIRGTGRFIQWARKSHPHLSQEFGRALSALALADRAYDISLSQRTSSS
jgi:predicted dehydrogenase